MRAMKARTVPHPSPHLFCMIHGCIFSPRGRGGPGAERSSPCSPDKGRQARSQLCPAVPLPHASLRMKMLQAADLENEELAMRESSALQNPPCIPSPRAGSRLTSLPGNANRFPLGRRSPASGRGAERRRRCGLGMPALLSNPRNRHRHRHRDTRGGNTPREPARGSPGGQVEECPPRPWERRRRRSRRGIMAEDARSGSGGKSSRWKQHKATNPCKGVCEPREQVLLWENMFFLFS